MSDASDTSETGSAHQKRALGGELILPAIAGLFGLYFLWDTWELVWEARINGILIVTPLFALILFKFVSVFSQISKGRGSMHFGELADWNDDQRKRLQLFAVFLGLAIFIGTLGLTLSLFVVLILSLWILEVRRWTILTLVPLITSLVVYGLFIALLQRRMPLGPVEAFLNHLLFGGAS